MGVKNAEKSVKFVREKRFTPVKKNKNRVKNGVHAQIGGSRPKKKTLLVAHLHILRSTRLAANKQTIEGRAVIYLLGYFCSHLLWF